jgi:hypothetical protein
MSMSLQNLLGISLDRITPDTAQVLKLLAAAERNIADAQLAGLSAENRFDAAYKAIMQLAMLARTPTATAPSPASPATIRPLSRP